MPPLLIRQHWQLFAGAAFVLLLLTVALAFTPGLGGSLIFDDLPNFLPWSDLGDVNNFHNVLTFTMSGAGVPGRPLSLLSFLIDDQSWQPDVFALKRTNLAIHLINCSLVFWLCLGVFRHLLRAETPVRQALLALIATAVWGLHPLQVSNVAYIIQRMNLLSSMLELIGLLLFLRGREQLATSPRSALLLCSLGIGAFVPLAILAKENGLLLCVFALLVEGFCFKDSPPLWWRNWKRLFLWLPLIAFVLFCLVQYRGFTRGFEIRNFSAWERLLTQGPVLIDYLDKLLLPRLHGSGLYFDNFPVSHSLFDPAWTFFSWLLLTALLLLAWRLRRTLPLFSFGIFFYFGGHLMESTVLPLELYYEHRNYLPQAGLWMALACLLSLCKTPLLRRVWPATVALLLCLLFVLTRHNAALWSNPDLQTAMWYHDNPGSLRSTLAYANLLLQKRDFVPLERVLREGHRQHPDDLALVISKRYVDCYWRNIPVIFDDLPALARKAEYEVASILMLEQMRSIGAQAKGHREALTDCHPATDLQIAAIYRALLQNPRYATSRLRSKVTEYLAEIAVAHRDLNSAVLLYDQAFAASPSPLYPYRQAGMLASAGLDQDAQAYAEKAERALTWKQRLLFPDLENRIRDVQQLLAARSKAKP